MFTQLIPLVGVAYTLCGFVTVNALLSDAYGVLYVFPVYFSLHSGLQFIHKPNVKKIPHVVLLLC